jgi:hypothetical protein
LELEVQYRVKNQENGNITEYNGVGENQGKFVVEEKLEVKL